MKQTAAILACLVSLFQLFPNDIAQSWWPIQTADNSDMGEKLRAAYIFNFIQFVEWPERAFEDSSDPIIVGVFSGSRLTAALTEIVRGEMINDRPITVRELSRPDQAVGCHVVVMWLAEEAIITRVLTSLKGSPALTIGESDGFAERGGAINFFVTQNKLRFSINPAVIKTNELKVSSRLLRLGTIVDTGSKEE